jgi:hypothetical protein
MPEFNLEQALEEERRRAFNRPSEIDTVLDTLNDALSREKDEAKRSVIESDLNALSAGKPRPSLLEGSGAKPHHADQLQDALNQLGVTSPSALRDLEARAAARLSDPAMDDKGRKAMQGLRLLIREVGDIALSRQNADVQETQKAAREQEIEGAGFLQKAAGTAASALRSFDEGLSGGIGGAAAQEIAGGAAEIGLIAGADDAQRGREMFAAGSDYASRIADSTMVGRGTNMLSSAVGFVAGAKGLGGTGRALATKGGLAGAAGKLIGGGRPRSLPGAMLNSAFNFGALSAAQTLTGAHAQSIEAWRRGDFETLREAYDAIGAPMTQEIPAAYGAGALSGSLEPIFEGFGNKVLRRILTKGGSIERAGMLRAAWGKTVAGMVDEVPLIIVEQPRDAEGNFTFGLHNFTDLLSEDDAVQRAAWENLLFTSMAGSVFRHMEGTPDLRGAVSDAETVPGGHRKLSPEERANVLTATEERVLREAIAEHVDNLTPEELESMNREALVGLIPQLNMLAQTQGIDTTAVMEDIVTRVGAAREKAMKDMDLSDLAGEAAYIQGQIEELMRGGESDRTLQSLQGDYQNVVRLMEKASGESLSPVEQALEKNEEAQRDWLRAHTLMQQVRTPAQFQQAVERSPLLQDILGVDTSGVLIGPGALRPYVETAQSGLRAARRDIALHRQELAKIRVAQESVRRGEAQKEQEAQVKDAQKLFEQREKDQEKAKKVLLREASKTVDEVEAEVETLFPGATPGGETAKKALGEARKAKTPKAKEKLALLARKAAKGQPLTAAEKVAAEGPETPQEAPAAAPVQTEAKAQPAAPTITSASDRLAFEHDASIPDTEGATSAVFDRQGDNAARKAAADQVQAGAVVPVTRFKLGEKPPTGDIGVFFYVDPAGERELVLENPLVAKDKMAALQALGQTPEQALESETEMTEFEQDKLLHDLAKEAGYSDVYLWAHAPGTEIMHIGDAVSSPRTPQGEDSPGEGEPEATETVDILEQDEPTKAALIRAINAETEGAPFRPTALKAETPASLKEILTRVRAGQVERAAEAVLAREEAEKVIDRAEEKTAKQREVQEDEAVIDTGEPTVVSPAVEAGPDLADLEPSLANVTIIATELERLGAARERVDASEAGLIDERIRELKVAKQDLWDRMEARENRAERREKGPLALATDEDRRVVLAIDGYLSRLDAAIEIAPEASKDRLRQERKEVEAMRQFVHRAEQTATVPLDQRPTVIPEAGQIVTLTRAGFAPADVLVIRTTEGKVSRKKRGLLSKAPGRRLEVLNLETGKRERVRLVDIGSLETQSLGDLNLHDKGTLERLERFARREQGVELTMESFARLFDVPVNKLGASVEGLNNMGRQEDSARRAGALLSGAIEGTHTALRPTTREVQRTVTITDKKTGEKKQVKRTFTEDTLESYATDDPRAIAESEALWRAHRFKHEAATPEDFALEAAAMLAGDAAFPVDLSHTQRSDAKAKDRQKMSARRQRQAEVIFQKQLDGVALTGAEQKLVEEIPEVVDYISNLFLADSGLRGYVPSDLGFDFVHDHGAREKAEDKLYSQATRARLSGADNAQQLANRVHRRRPRACRRARPDRTVQPGGCEVRRADAHGHAQAGRERQDAARAALPRRPGHARGHDHRVRRQPEGRPRTGEEARGGPEGRSGQGPRRPPRPVPEARELLLQREGRLAVQDPCAQRDALDPPHRGRRRPFVDGAGRVPRHLDRRGHGLPGKASL